MEKSDHCLLTPSGPLYKKGFITKAVQTDQSFAFCRKLNLENLEDSDSTPPSELKRELSFVRHEMDENNEFHDLELAILKEEYILKDIEFKMNNDITELKKSLEDAEKHIDDANKEITQLKVINQDLNKKLKDESNQNVILKEQYEDKMAKLLQNLEEKKCVIQILENDKNDSTFKIENLREIYDRKINELQLALDSANEKITKIESEKYYICDTPKQRVSKEKERVNEVSKGLEDKKIELTFCEHEIMTHEGENETGGDSGCHKNKNFSSIKNVRLQNNLMNTKIHKEHSQENNFLCVKELQTVQKEVDNVSQEFQHRNENFIGTNLSIVKELEGASKIVKGQIEKIENFNNVKKLNNSNGNSNQNLVNFTTENLMSHILDEKSFETYNQEKYLSNILPSDKTKQIEEIVPKINKNVIKNISEYDDKELITHMNTNNKIPTVDAYFNEIVNTNSSKIFAQNSMTENNARHNDEDTFNFICELHTLDEKKMQLNINSESKMTDFINEFARILLKNNIIDLNELKTCSNIFYFLLNKYLALMQLNSHLKTKFGIYRLSEQKECYNIMVHCLDNLCSQLEESSNLSDSSLVFFKDCPASSTMMDFSEVEISVINDITLKVNDPLALTNEISYQTPLKNILKSSTKNTSFDFKTPLKSVSKCLRMPSKTPLCSTKKQISDEPNGEKIGKGLAEIHFVQPLNSLVENEKGMFESNIDSDKELRDAEAAMDSTMETFSLLEERFMKLENILTTFQTEKEKLTKENERLQELLLKKNKEIEDVKEKLIIEIISLNSELQGTLSDVLATDILSIFINTVRESCYKIPELLSQKSSTEIEELKVKINAYEAKIQESDKTIEKLHDLVEAHKTEKEALEKDISDRNEEIKTLQLEVLDIQTLKLKVENLEEKIKEKEAILETETFSRKNISKDLEKLKIIYENIESENMALNKTKKELEKNITDINVELKIAKEQLLNDENREEELTKEIERLRSALAEAEERNDNLKETIQRYEADIISAKNSNAQKIFEIKFLNEKHSTKNYLHEKEQIISEMNCTVSNAKSGKCQSRDKIIRKLEKLKELNESLAEVIIKMLSLTAYENSQQMNLTTNSGFLNQREQILSHFENWIHSKKKEVQELKEHIKELDEECESYAKEIKEAKKETVKIWEEGQANVNTLKSQIAQTQEEYKSLKSEKEKLQEKISTFKSDTLKMDINEGTAYENVIHQQENERKTPIKLKHSSVSTEKTANELEKLNEENTVLQSHILDLEKEIAQSKEEVKKLDEECEYYAKVITECQKETVKIWEEGKVEINNLKSQIEVLQQENKNLKLEKENGFKKCYKNCNSKTKPYNEIEKEEAEFISCYCEKKANELKSGILLKEMKILESEQPLEKNIHQLWIVHLENSLAHFKKQFAEEKDKNKRLQEQLNEFSNGERKNVLSENVLWEKLKNKNFLEPNTVQQIEDRERIQKLEKDNKMLKELCRTRYNEIRKLEKENLSLKGHERIKK